MAIVHPLSRLCNCVSSSIQPFSCFNIPSFLPDLAIFISVRRLFLLPSLSLPPHFQMLLSLMARGSCSEDPSRCYLSLQGHLGECTRRRPNVFPATGLPSRSIMANCTTAAGSERTGDRGLIKFMKTGIFLKAGVTKRSWRWYNSIPLLWKILTSSGWKHSTEPDN